MSKIFVWCALCAITVADSVFLIDLPTTAVCCVLEIDYCDFFFQFVIESQVTYLVIFVWCLRWIIFKPDLYVPDFHFLCLTP